MLLLGYFARPGDGAYRFHVLLGVAIEPGMGSLVDWLVRDWLCGPLTIQLGQSAFLPAIDANHDQTWNVETDATGNDCVGRGQVQGTGWILYAGTLVGNVGAVQVQRDGHKGHESCQQPDDDNRSHRHPPRHPAAVSVGEERVDDLESLIIMKWASQNRRRRITSTHKVTSSSIDSNNRIYLTEASLSRQGRRGKAKY